MYLIEINSVSSFSIVFSPYIKLEALKKINASNSIQKIVVAWHKEDLLKGVSDHEVFIYCKENNIELYRNPRIHLKVLWDGDQRIVLGSANITQSGLGLSENANHELSVQLKYVSDEVKAYLKSIVSASQLITDTIYKQILQQLESDDMPYSRISDFEFTEEIEDYFLMSQLPQSYSPEYLLSVMKSQSGISELDRMCLESDLKTYKVVYRSDEQFLADLSNLFLMHPFVKKFSKYIEEVGSLRYGGAVEWIQANCKNVPTPRRLEIKKDGVVNILYRWLCYFDPTFEVTRPNHSEIIRKKAG